MTDANAGTPAERPDASVTSAGAPQAALSSEIIQQAQTAFTHAAPDIRQLAHHFHRRLHGEPHDEAVAETEAFVWKAFRKLVAEGRDPLPLVGNIVDFAARRVRSGRRFAGKVHVQDALSTVSRHREGYFVTSLPHADDEEVAGEVRDALAHRVPGPAEEAITKADWEAFLQSLPDEKYREMAQGLAEGLTQAEIGESRGVSKAATQQLGGRLRAKYAEFHGGGKSGR